MVRPSAQRNACSHLRDMFKASERFNRTYQEDVLDAYIIESLNELEELSDSWRDEYNSCHPHQALKRMSPIVFANASRRVIDAYESV